MKRFLFRLEILLKVRQAKEGRLQRDLTYIEQKWNQLKEKKESIETQIAALLEAIRKKREKKEYGLQETYAQLLEHLNASLIQVKETLELQGRQIAEKREQLKQALQERKVIEKIKEKQYTQWRIQAECEEDEAHF